MSNASIRRLIGGLGTALILVICAVVIVAHFLTGRNLQRIDVSEYTNIVSDGKGGYTAELDLDRLISTERLYHPTEAEMADHPEIAALRSLAVRVTQKGDLYEMETVTSGEDPTALLKKHGIRLINTKWTKSAAELSGKEQPAKDETLDFSKYVRTNRNADGSFGAVMDNRAMLIDCGFDPDRDPAAYLGARALASIGISCQKASGGYQMQITSSLPTVMDDLKAAGIAYRNTKWTWTDAEMAEHVGTVTVPETAAPETPAQQASASETPAPETTAPTTPSGTFNDVPNVTPTATPTRNEDAIDSLYGFDQTEVRKAIRAAKEQKYGSSIESSEVKFNYFAVGNDSAAHTNVFRLVYLITTSNSTEYLVADVYDLESETGYSPRDVHLTVEKDRNRAKSTDDLKDYKVYTLNGGSMVFEENEGRSPFDDDGLVMAKSTREAVSYDELWDIPQTSDLTLLQLLGYARNEMFAVGGHQFGDTSNYLKYYKQFKWYKPTGKVSADELAKKYPATKGNITTIKFLEKLIKEG
ncbi:MAG: YARHG domain-containing protein [Clostridia bacterium]|nr:YARHG domain-containing protein [Clostridia bacterium]